MEKEVQTRSQYLLRSGNLTLNETTCGQYHLVKSICREELSNKILDIDLIFL